MKVGILTSGGDTQGMNAVIRAAWIRAKVLGHELIGVRYGWKGLMEGDFFNLPENMEELIDLGGTILGSSRQNPYARDDGVNQIREVVKANKIDAIIAIGGEDTLGVANKLTNDGLPMIGVPKTIDNDLDATDYTFGFNTAYTIATDAIDKAKTTAKSHDRVLVMEIMGRHAGWLTLYAGIAGGAHAILIPEFEVSIDQLAEVIKKRFDSGKKWGIIVVSEGFGFKEGKIDESAEKDEFGHVRLEQKEIGKYIASKLKEKLGIETREIVLGHIQRGGPPSAYDRVLCTRLGIMAMDLVDVKDFGKMPALRGTSVVPVKLEEAVARLKTVDEEHWQIAKKLMRL
jgi:ATP-dependent phosphofructokinase / diphosphate-dependent phosphofructokinase